VFFFSFCKSSLAKVWLQIFSRQIQSKLGRMLSGQLVDTLSFDGQKVRGEPWEASECQWDSTDGTPAAVCFSTVDVYSCLS
jgi:hypothetical protein